MNYLKKKCLTQKIVKLADKIVSVFILATIVGVVVFTGVQVFYLFQHVLSMDLIEILHTVAIVVILVKAYRLLLFYMESHHVSVKYIIEISIIAPAVELIFAPGNRDLWLNVVYAVFSLANLIVYLRYHKTLDHIDEEHIEEADLLHSSS